MATYALCFLSQHSRTRPNVPAQVRVWAWNCGCRQCTGMCSPAVIQLARRLTFTHFAEYLVCSISTTSASKPCWCKAFWKQMMADTYILKSSSPQAETHNVPPAIQTKKLRKRCKKMFSILSEVHLQSLQTQRPASLSCLTLSSALYAGDGLFGTMNAEVSVAAGTPGRSTG